MNALFRTLLTMSLSGGILVAVVALLRPVLRKAPKRLTCLFWIPVAIILLIPLRIPSPVSLMPNTESLAEEILSVQPPVTVITQESAPGEPLPEVNPPDQEFVFQFWIVWVAGMTAMAVYALVSYLTVRRRVSVCLEWDTGIYICDYIGSPFVLGLFHPRIYLPSTLPAHSADHVLAHEQAHLCRKDHWWKPLGFLLLTIHWFNPLIWLGYILLCRDIELACDERVIRDMNQEDKKAYSQALLACSSKRPLITACPLAFGESGVKVRIKSVLNYKKPAFWLILATVLICVAVTVCFLTVRPDPTYSFDAKIIELSGSSLLLEPLPGHSIRSSADRVYVGIPEETDAGRLIQQGYVRVEYDGMIQDTSPTRILNVFSIVPLDTIPEEAATPSFQAYVLDTGSDHMLLQPREGTPLRQETNRVLIVHDAHMPVPALAPGDLVTVQYRGALLYSDPPQLRNIVSVELVKEADWGVSMDVVTCSPTGITLRLLQDSGWPRHLRYDQLYYLERFTENGWEALKKNDHQTASSEWISLENGAPKTLQLDWTDRYGELPAGRYRIVKNISCFAPTAESVRQFYGEFAVGSDISDDFESALTQMIYSALSGKFPVFGYDLTPVLPNEEEEKIHDAQPPEPYETGLRLVESHMILEHQTLGSTHTVALNVLCRRYFQGAYVDELYTPLLLTFTNEAHGVYHLTESRVPREGSFRHDIETCFPAAAVEKALNCKQFYQQLLELCKLKAPVPVVEPFRSVVLEKTDPNAKIILGAMSLGEKINDLFDFAPDYIVTVDNKEYHYSRRGIFNLPAEGISYRLTPEDTALVTDILKSY